MDCDTLGIVNGSLAFMNMRTFVSHCQNDGGVEFSLDAGEVREGNPLQTCAMGSSLLFEQIRKSPLLYDTRKCLTRGRMIQESRLAPAGRLPDWMKC